MTRRHHGKRRAQKVVIHRPKGTTCALGPPEPAPLRALVLNLDAAMNTGTAVYIDGRLRAYSETRSRDPHARKQVIRECMHAAEVRGLPLAIVAEAPWGGYVNAAISLSTSVALWRDTWLALGGDAWHFVELTAGEWRRAIIGRASMTREQSRAWEAVNARGRVLADMTPDAARIGFKVPADAAAAICLGMATCRSSGVRKRLGCDLVRPLVAAERPKPT